MSIKTGKELAAAAKAVASNKTLYIMGCFGAPMSDRNKEKYINHHEYNRGPGRPEKIRAATADTFGFDCCGLIKGLLWGWDGDTRTTYGGAAYASNSVPDYNADKLIQVCGGVTSDFSNIQVGEVVWRRGHIGVYIGNGLAVESTPKWKDSVQITAVLNIGSKAGYNGRKWTKHGRLPYVTYAADYKLEMRSLRKGSTGDDVRALQILLNGRGYYCGAADGTFGNQTDKAVRAYQEAKKLTADGIAGPATMRSLLGA